MNAQHQSGILRRHSHGLENSVLQNSLRYALSGRFRGAQPVSSPEISGYANFAEAPPAWSNLHGQHGCAVFQLIEEVARPKLAICPVAPIFGIDPVALRDQNMARRISAYDSEKAPSQWVREITFHQRIRLSGLMWSSAEPWNYRRLRRQGGAQNDGKQDEAS
jgi:hypothetical protein